CKQRDSIIQKTLSTTVTHFQLHDLPHLLLIMGSGTLICKAQSAFNAGDYQLAERKFTEAIALVPTNQEIRILKGLSLERQGKLDDTLRECDKLLELFPYCSDAWTYKSVLFNNRSLFEAAEMCASNALR